MILVTGAAGKTGQAVVQALVERRQAVRALVRRDDHVSGLRGLGAREVVIGDLQIPEDVSAATRGARAIYHICPNMHREEVTIGENAITAAKSAGCERFAYHSVLHPQTEAMPHHWRKLRVEEKLLESGLAFTVLQPTASMQNVLAGWKAVVDRGVYAVPYTAETRISMVDLGDVAEAAARILTEPGHDGATYQLCGPGYLSQHEVAARIGERVGREVRAEAVPLDAWKTQARAAGLSDDKVETLARMFLFYERHGLRGNPRVLEWLLGRPPASFEQFLQGIH